MPLRTMVLSVAPIITPSITKAGMPVKAAIAAKNRNSRAPACTSGLVVITPISQSPPNQKKQNITAPTARPQLMVKRIACSKAGR